jgi:protein gp37
VNKTKIEWADYTWNPISGCKHGCPYCYARRIAERFQATAFPNGFLPAFYPDRLNEPQKVKKFSRIFVGSMGDLFGDWDWARASGPDVQSQTVIEMVLKAVEECRQHTFIFLTKNPARYSEFYRKYAQWPDNTWLGTSVDTVASTVNANELSQNVSAPLKFVSIEPLLEDVAEYIDFYGLDWVIVGAQTGPRAVAPKPEWVKGIIDRCRKYGIPIFLKDNLNWPEKIQEFPEATP